LLDRAWIPKRETKLWTSNEFEHQRRGNQSAWSPRLAKRIHKTLY